MKRFTLRRRLDLVDGIMEKLTFLNLDYTGKENDLSILVNYKLRNIYSLGAYTTVKKSLITIVKSYDDTTSVSLIIRDGRLNLGLVPKFSMGNVKIYYNRDIVKRLVEIIMEEAKSEFCLKVEEIIRC